MTSRPAQKPLFATLCATCDGLGYLPELDADGTCTGWADPCPDCSPDGVREYDPFLAEIPW